jgi:hypothetical protein
MECAPEPYVLVLGSAVPVRQGHTIAHCLRSAALAAKLPSFATRRLYFPRGVVKRAA